MQEFGLYIWLIWSFVCRLNRLSHAVWGQDQSLHLKGFNFPTINSDQSINLWTRGTCDWLGIEHKARWRPLRASSQFFLLHEWWMQVTCHGSQILAFFPHFISTASPRHSWSLLVCFCPSCSAIGSSVQRELWVQTQLFFNLPACSSHHHSEFTYGRTAFWHPTDRRRGSTWRKHHTL